MNWLDRNLAYGPYLILCLNQKELDEVYDHLSLKKKHRPRFPSVPANTTTFKHRKGKEPICVVCLNLSPGTKGLDIAGILAHEAVHVWQTHERWIGEKKSGDETEAYAIQHIAQKLMESYCRKIRKARKK